MISFDVDSVIFSFAPNEMKILSRYYFNFSNGLVLSNVEYNSLFYITIKLSDRSLERIKRIDLSQYRSIDSFVDNIALYRLNPYILNMDDTVFTRIGHMYNLTELSLVNNFYVCNDSLKALTGLKKLDITNTNIDDHGIKNLKNLESITIGIDYNVLDRELDEYKIFISLYCLKQLNKLSYIKIHYGYDYEEYTNTNQIKDI